MKYYIFVSILVLLSTCKFPFAYPTEEELPLIELEVEKCVVSFWERDGEAFGIITIYINDDYVTDPVYTHDGVWNFTGSIAETFHGSSYKPFDKIYLNGVAFTDIVGPSPNTTFFSHAELDSFYYYFIGTWDPEMYKEIYFDNEDIFYFWGIRPSITNDDGFIMAKGRIKTESVEITYE